MRLEYLVLLIGYIISLCVGGLYFTTGNILVVLSGVISSVISGATALFLAKRSQIQKNTQAIREKEQYDIKKTVDMFSRDYAETLKKNAELADENKRLIQENTSLRAEIEVLENKQIREKKQEQNIGEGKSPRLIL